MRGYWTEKCFPMELGQKDRYEPESVPPGTPLPRPP